MNKPHLDSINRKVTPFSYWSQKVIPVVYDDSLSYYELLAKVVNQLNETGQLTNDMVDLWNQVNQWIANEGIADTVDERLDEMAKDGTLDQIINVSIFNELNDQIKIKKGNTFGTFANAALQSVIANSPSGVPQVLGIPLDRDDVLASYDNRDSVASYRANSSRYPTLEINSVTYSVNGVTVPNGTDLSKVQIGMIVDTKHQTKYSGIIIGIVDNLIQINNWYQMGNKEKGQIPGNGAGIKIDPITKVWVDNVNLFLEKDDPYSAGSIVEYGMINNQGDGGDRSGVDVVSLGSNHPDIAFKARGTTDKNNWNTGFYDKDSNNALMSGNHDKNANLIHNAVTGFFIKNNGNMNALNLRFAHSGQTKTLNPSDFPMFLMTNSDVHHMPEPKDYSSHMTFVLNTTNGNVLMSGIFVNPSIPGSYEVPPGFNVFFSDGGSWYHS